MLEHHTLIDTGRLALSDVRCSCPKSGWSVEETVDRTRLVLSRRGVFEHRSRGASTLVEPNHLLWFHHDRPYRVRHPIDGGDRCTVVAVRSDELFRAAESLGLDPALTPRLSGATVTTTLDDAHRTVLQLARSAPLEDPLALAEAGLRLLTLALEATADRLGLSVERDVGTFTASRKIAERARLALAEHLERSLSLEDLAHLTDCSPSHLCRLFRRETGLSLGRYRQRLRVRTALDRLAEGEDDLTTLALDLGFYDHAHFTRTFRAETGMPPSRWREAWRSNA